MQYPRGRLILFGQLLIGEDPPLARAGQLQGGLLVTARLGMLLVHDMNARMSGPEHGTMYDMVVHADVQKRCASITQGLIQSEGLFNRHGCREI